MGKFPGLMIILASSLLFFLQTLEVVNGAKCYGSLASNSSYAQNRRNLFSTLANKVLTNGGVYTQPISQQSLCSWPLRKRLQAKSLSQLSRKIDFGNTKGLSKHHGFVRLGQ